MTTLICDLDGTLSKYPGSHQFSLYSKLIEFNDISKELNTIEKYDIIRTNQKAAKDSAELMVNRYNQNEIKILTSNIKILHEKYGPLILFSLNFKIVAIEYMRELRVDEYFDFENSYFRDNLSANPRKEEIWNSIINKNSKIIYIDDDESILNKLKKLSDDKDIKFIHMKEWMGITNINDYI